MWTAEMQNPPRLEGPQGEESENEEKEEDNGEISEAENEQDEPPPQKKRTPDEDHISPARRANRRETEMGGQAPSKLNKRKQTGFNTINHRKKTPNEY